MIYIVIARGCNVYRNMDFRPYRPSLGGGNGSGGGGGNGSGGGGSNARYKRYTI